MSTATVQRERTVHHIAESAQENPYHRPSFSFKHRLVRVVWQVTYLLLYRLSPTPLYGWRAMLLRLFGAKVGAGCHFYPSGKVWAPWNLICEDLVTAGDGAEIYNPAPVHLGSHAILSQNSYICGAAYDFDDLALPLRTYYMEVGAYAWICARASICPGVRVGEGAVLGLGSTATCYLEPWGVYAGTPAVKVKDRKRVR